MGDLAALKSAVPILYEFQHPKTDLKLPLHAYEPFGGDSTLVHQPSVFLFLIHDDGLLLNVTLNYSLD